MAGVPYIFGNATTSIPLTNLDANFNTGVTIGNATVGLGNTVTTLGNVTLTNVNIVSVGSGNIPAFSATKSTAQTPVTSGAFTTVTFDVEQFDTNNNFASNTFTPTVAGYYQINGNVYASATTVTRLIAQILKNGGSYRFGVDVPLSVGAGEYRSTVSAIVYMNGTTDYLNLAALVIGTGTINFGSGIDNCALNGVLVRTA